MSISILTIHIVATSSYEALTSNTFHETSKKRNAQQKQLD